MSKSSGFVMRNGKHEAGGEYVLNVDADGGVIFYRYELESPALPSTRQLPFGWWSHVAVAFDGLTARLYINGTSAGSKECGVTRTPDSCKRGVDPLVIGALRYGNVYAASFDGHIDEVQVWDRPLNNIKLYRNLNASLTDQESGLLAYFKFNEGVGTVAKDSTGRKHTGQLGGGSPRRSPRWAPSDSPQGRGEYALSYDRVAIVLPVLVTAMTI
jgi:hypothetical protein